MKLSTRGRYGVKAMLDLAQRYGTGPVSVKDIAERQRLSEHYLEQLVATLRKAGLITSVRGAQGGYELARDPSVITVGDVIGVLEGPISLVDCLDKEASETCDQLSKCMTRTVWKKLRDSMEQVLNSTSLKDLLEEGTPNEADVASDNHGEGLGCPSTS